MPAPFTALEARLNAAAMGKLANAVAMVGSESVAGDFSEPYAEACGMGGTRPVFRCLRSALETLATVIAVDTVLTIRGRNFRVAEINPEDGGIVVLILEAA